MPARDEHRDGDQPAIVRLLWSEGRSPSRGPRPAFDLARIARAGIEVADADGLDAVTMQRVAGQLGFTKMALYRYVPGKAELVALMVDAALGEPPASDAAPAGDWRVRLDIWARRLLAGFQRHPWTLEATVGPRVMGPNELGWLEYAVAALEGTGLDGGERMDAAVVLVSHIRGIVQQATATTPGVDPDRALGEILARLLATRQDRYPAVSAALASAVTAGSQGNALDFGLARILDGLADLIARRAGEADRG